MLTVTTNISFSKCDVSRPKEVKRIRKTKFLCTMLESHDKNLKLQETAVYKYYLENRYKGWGNS